ncbi:hypothetical protein EVAR_46227_1 [Eumeta japonica]|uniref:Uncharacterized protein n=1 Tax=Eumeta variegata TaxID=151549 RepID=A0A4C1XN27_EUMVA|nr:hypothetical protein EVAR_46227_1 [Eumeta japonica]
MFDLTVGGAEVGAGEVLALSDVISGRVVKRNDIGTLRSHNGHFSICIIPLGCPIFELNLGKSPCSEQSSPAAAYKEVVVELYFDDIDL